MSVADVLNRRMTVKKFFALLALVSLGSTFGCHISSAVAPNTALTGEVWYTKMGPFGMTTIFYCDGKGTCKEADMK